MQPRVDASSPAHGLKGRAASLWRPRNPHFQLQAALALAFFVAAVAFGHITEDYLDRDAIVRWDVEFSRWLHHQSASSLVSFFNIATWAGNAAFLAIVTVLVAVVLLRRRAVNEAVLVCAVALGIEVINAGLKLAFHRPRPKLAYTPLDTYSFPSGHAAGSAAIYAVLLYLVARHRSIGIRLACTGLFVGLVALIGFSRLYLQVHYLSDVLAGISLGAAWVAACLFVYELRGGRDVTRLLPPRVQVLLERAARKP